MSSVRYSLFSRLAVGYYINNNLISKLWFAVIHHGVRQATDDSMARAHCMLRNQGYRHALRICTSYCFSTSTVVTRTRLNITLYLHCLSCYN